jgi:trigger factor
LEGKSGGEVVPGTVAEGYSVALGKGYLEEKLEAGIIGMEVGETKVISIEYPEDQPNSEIAGKTVNFTVKLTGIQEREYPELNDEFAQDVSGSETLEEWKEKIKADLEAKINSQAEDALQNELVDKVVQDSALELPRFTLEQYEILAEERMKMMLAYQGITWEGYAKFLEKDGKNQQQEIRSIAEKDLKEDFVLLALADAEKFEPSSEEIQATVKKLEQSASKDSKLSQDELVDRASAQLRSQKARQFIREHAVVEEVIEQQEDRSEKNEHTSTDGGGTD